MSLRGEGGTGGVRARAKIGEGRAHVGSCHMETPPVNKQNY